MAVSRLTCPECETVLRPAKPLPVGKRVKCPKCGTTFTAVDSEEEEPPRPAKKPARSREEPEEPLGTGIHYETSTYAVIKDDDDDRQREEKEERGEEMVAEFLKVAKTKDPRGPAQEMVTKPSNYLLLTGFLGALGYAILLVFFIIIYLMPAPKVEELDEGAKKKKLKGLMIEPAVSAVAGFEDPTKKAEEEKKKKQAEEAAFMVLIASASAIAFAVFLLLCSFYLIGIIYCAFVIYGAVKIQNLTQRGWGIASSILAMIPMTTFGFYGVTGILAWMVFSLLYDDPGTVRLMLIAVGVLELIWAIGIGVWNLMTLMDPAVIAGYEYIEDQEEEPEEDED
jgi:predicted Zn finger-like uncharacterized protein